MLSDGPFYHAGRYRCEITQQALTKAQTGTVQLVLRFNVLECLTPLGEVEQCGRTAYIPITTNSMPYVLPKLEALGYTRDSIRFLDPTVPNHHSFLGQSVEMFCKHENNRDGQLREKWDIAKPGSASKAIEVTPVDSAALRQLDMLFNKQRKEALPPAPAKQTARQPVAAGNQGISESDMPTDDDVPF